MLTLCDLNAQLCRDTAELLLKTEGTVYELLLVLPRYPLSTICKVSWPAVPIIVAAVRDLDQQRTYRDMDKQRVRLLDQQVAPQYTNF
jgi:hypothetical protein